MIFTKSLSELDGNDVVLAGGKGASLGEMLRARLPVPPGFVVLTTAFERCVRDLDLPTGTEVRDDLAGAPGLCERLAALFRDMPIPDEVARQIEQSFGSLNAGYVAVRSSATSEDSSAHSWAGQLETYLNTSHEQLLSNIRRCWSSLFTPRAVAYRQMKGLAETMSMAVVVQAMIPAEVSGTAFSVHPVSEDPNVMVIEAGYGLGEAVVSGSITPDTYIVRKQPRAIERIDVSVQSLALYGEAEGGCRWRPPAADLLGRQKLRDDHILALAELVVAIQEYYGSPRDIEWAFADSRFYIVQSRPLTRKAP
jgi:phosphoenolpyruvate synthase/pyruvate phosphate dikinase